MTEQGGVLREQKQVFQHGVVRDEDVRRLNQHFIACKQPVLRHGFGRLEKLEKMVQSFCEKGPNAISLDEIIDQVNLAKFHLASAREAESVGS